MADRMPSLFALHLIGSAVQEMREETKKDIGALVERGARAEKLLAECLPFLRETAAKKTRAAVVALLSEPRP